MAQNDWVRVGASGRLLYTMDARGDRILDFSNVGYRGGDVPLPNYQEVVASNRVISLSPIAGDNLAQIQNAINSVQNLPLNENGFRGVVQLSAGDFDISDSIKISKSGVILRGVGDSSNPFLGTSLNYTGTSQIRMVEVGNGTSLQVAPGTTRSVVDKVVPAGATSFTLDSTKGLRTGDKIVIHRPATQEWIDYLGMDDLGSKPDVRPWTPEEERYQQYYERTVTHIDEERGRVFLDTPLAHSLEQRFGTATVSQYTFDRVANVGIENLRGNGQKTVGSPTDENHAYHFVQFDEVEHSWVRNVTGEHLIHGTVIFRSESKHNTVLDARSVDPISQLTGGRRYAFNMEGQLSIMEDLRSDRGRHDFVNNNPSRGPNVFLDAVATNSYSDSGPHQRYSTGTLYDNIVETDYLSVRNRYDSGTGHGWTGANMVIWNSEAEGFSVQNTPGAQNWLIGSSGLVANPGQYPPGYVNAHNQRQILNGEDSLYRAQRNERLAHIHETSREYWLGDFDEFEYDGASDNPAVDPVWAAQLQAAMPFTPLVGTDTATFGGQIVPLTFDFDVPLGVATSAVLTLSLDRYGFSSNRPIWIESLANQLQVGDLNFLPTFGDSDIVMIELLPDSPGGGLSFLEDGRLNIAVGGSQRVDWADLQFTFELELSGVEGDLNQDGIFDIDDLHQFIDHWRSRTAGLPVPERLWRGDLNLDGETNLLDAALMRTALLNSPLSNQAELLAALGIAPTVVPEPATLALCLLGVAAYSARRWQSKSALG